MINYPLDYIKNHILGTKVKEEEWAKRNDKHNDWGKEEKDWIQSYWDSRNHPHRSFLIEKITKFSPSSILEIGCNCGPNLYLLSKKFPTARIVGIDINPLAIQRGNEWLVKEEISNVNLLLGKADEFKKLKKFDIVFTDAVLIYIGRDKIKKVLKEMISAATKAIILVEWHSPESDWRGNYYRGCWKRDYTSLLAQFKLDVRITKLSKNIWPDKNWMGVGAIIEIIKK
ncbi:MAG: class I SAM-dependent methyltransferase [Nanoarchaeota archaeon]